MQVARQLAKLANVSSLRENESQHHTTLQMQSDLLLQHHIHRFNMWINPTTDRPATPRYVCKAMIRQSLFRTGVQKPVSQKETCKLVAIVHIPLGQVQYLNLMSVVSGGCSADVMTTGELIHGLIYSLMAFVIRLKLTDVKILQLDPSNSSAVTAQTG